MGTGQAFISGVTITYGGMVNFYFLKRWFLLTIFKGKRIRPTDIQFSGIITPLAVVSIINFHLFCVFLNFFNFYFNTPRYFTNSTVLNSFNRCLVMTGSSSINVTNNLCYNIVGSSFVLDTGLEFGNVFDSNLVLRAV
jgi:hypothetical protein